jgi:beta-glucanase (GH16 family)
LPTVKHSVSNHKHSITTQYYSRWKLFLLLQDHHHLLLSITMVSQLVSLCLLLATARAAIPQLSGYRVVWSDDFNGGKGAAVDSSKWNQISNVKNSNNEQQIYTEYASNAHLSGDGQLYIVPTKHSGATTYWTSARLESTGSWTPGAGKATLYQAEVRVPDFTGNPAKFAGLWPAFWTKGNSFRTSNVPWPTCGEWDILEVVSQMSNRNQATIHFTDATGHHNGAFNGQVTYQGGAYHTWAVKVDRRNSDWKQQTITVYLDGKAFYHFTGANIGTLAQWKTLAWSPYYFILNIAIGGNYSGPTTASTVDGYEASMRVRYVATYEST